MKTSTRLAIAFLAIASTASTAAFASDRHGGRMNQRALLNFDRADTDESGDIPFDEFAAAMQSRTAKADANSDGKMTVEEIADEIVRMRALRQAERMVKRFDTDGDGALTTAEIEAGQKRIFSRLDRNEDGKLKRKELRRGKHHRNRDRGPDRL